MARQCRKCMNEGRIIGTDEYCTCMFGRQKRASDEQYVRQAKAEIEAVKTLEKAKKAPKVKERTFAVEDGDWTTHDNYVGVVTDIDGDMFTFVVSHMNDPKNGKRIVINKHVKAHLAKFLPAPIETFDNEREMFVQMAFITGDTKLFSEATEGLYENKATRKKCLDLMVEWSLKFKDEEMFNFATDKLKKVKK